jgi:hypothetical protein
MWETVARRELFRTFLATASAALFPPFLAGAATLPQIPPQPPGPSVASETASDATFAGRGVDSTAPSDTTSGELQ